MAFFSIFETIKNALPVVVTSGLPNVWKKDLDRRFQFSRKLKKVSVLAHEGSVFGFVLSVKKVALQRFGLEAQREILCKIQEDVSTK